jgi:hypothetical protein
MGLRPSDWIQVEGLSLSCGQVNQKILAIEMATKIGSLFFNNPNFISIFSFFVCLQPNLGC